MSGPTGTALLLLLSGIFVLFLELFIPSAGFLLVVGILCVGASLIVAFASGGMQTGFAFLTAVCVLTPILSWGGFQLWKRSPFGRRMFLDASDDARSSISSAGDELAEDAIGVGQIGRTLTPLRPAGMTDFMGRRIDTVSEGVMIERGEFVRVVEIQGNRVVVRRLSPDELHGVDSVV